MLKPGTMDASDTFAFRQPPNAAHSNLNNLDAWDELLPFDDQLKTTSEFVQPGSQTHWFGYELDANNTRDTAAEEAHFADWGVGAPLGDAYEAPRDLAGPVSPPTAPPAQGQPPAHQPTSPGIQSHPSTPRGQRTYASSASSSPSPSQKRGYMAFTTTSQQQPWNAKLAAMALGGASPTQIMAAAASAMVRMEAMRLTSPTASPHAAGASAYNMGGQTGPASRVYVTEARLRDSPTPGAPTGSSAMPSQYSPRAPPPYQQPPAATMPFEPQPVHAPRPGTAARGAHYSQQAPPYAEPQQRSHAGAYSHQATGGAGATARGAPEPQQQEYGPGPNGRRRTTSGGSNGGTQGGSGADGAGVDPAVVAKLQAQMSALEGSNQDLSRKLADAQAAAEALRIKLEESETREADLKSKATQAESRCKALEQQVSTQQSQLDALSSQLQRAQHEVIAQQDRVAAVADEKSTLQEQAAEKKKEMEQMCRKLDHFGHEERKLQGEVQALRKETGALQDALNRSRAEAAELKDLLRAAQMEAQRSAAQVSRAEAGAGGAMAQLQALRAKCAELDSRNAQLAQQVTAARDEAARARMDAEAVQVRALQMHRSRPAGRTTADMDLEGSRYGDLPPRAGSPGPGGVPQYSSLSYGPSSSALDYLPAPSSQNDLYDYAAPKAGYGAAGGVRAAGAPSAGSGTSVASLLRPAALPPGSSARVGTLLGQGAGAGSGNGSSNSYLNGSSSYLDSAAGGVSGGMGAPPPSYNSWLPPGREQQPGLSRGYGSGGDPYPGGGGSSKLSDDVYTSLMSRLDREAGGGGGGAGYGGYGAYGGGRQLDAYGSPGAPLDARAQSSLAPISSGPDVWAAPRYPGASSAMQGGGNASPPAATRTDSDKPFGTERNLKDMLTRTQAVEDRLIGLCQEKSALEAEYSKMPLHGGRTNRERGRKAEVESRMEYVNKEISALRLALKKMMPGK